MFSPHPIATLTVLLTQGHMGTIEGCVVQRSLSVWRPGLLRLHGAVPSELAKCGIFILKGHYLFSKINHAEGHLAQEDAA